MSTAIQRRINAYAGLVRSKQRYIVDALADLSHRFIVDDNDFTLQFVVGRIYNDETFAFIDQLEELSAHPSVEVEVDKGSGVILARMQLLPASLNQTVETLRASEPNAVHYFRFYTESTKDDVDKHLRIPAAFINRVWFDAVSTEEGELTKDFGFFDFGVGSMEFYMGVEDETDENIYIDYGQALANADDVMDTLAVTTPTTLQ
ncbi:hypothetical protein SM033_00126 [Vibrio phage vB_VpaM_sm033]|nr:hypothetical protein SM033_00126 [Vibrio phage vB_VpaM_sm033]